MIGHDIAAALPAMRAEAESLMVSRCTIERLTTVWDEVEQKTMTTWSVVHSDIPCALTVPSASPRALLAGEAVTPETPIVKVPVAVDGIEADDRVTLADGTVAWVTHSPIRDHQVQRRLVCRWLR